MITFNKVSFRYAPGSRAILDEVNLRIEEGDLSLVVGRTGTGKSTLLGAVNGLVPWFSGGELRGEVWVDGLTTRRARPRDLADRVGYVGQNPLAGFVTDRVEDEVAYGMEQLGITPVAMRKRVEETLDLMGIAELRRRPLVTLSGGQQQRVAIAAVLAAQPRVLVLDEPTSALDPTAAQDVLAAITTLVHDVGMTVVLAEHRLERVMQAADTVAWLPGDGQVLVGPAAEMLRTCNVVPPLAALARTLGWNRVPLSVREARRWVHQQGITIADPPRAAMIGGESVVRVRGLTVSYGQLKAVNHVDLDLATGSVTALMGRNGAGKSSLMWALQGAVPSSGSVLVDGVDPRSVSAARARELISLVPQSPSDLLYLPTVEQECRQADQESGVAAGTTRAVLARLGMELDADRNPRDLSEGQRLALVLAIQLCVRPRVILLDEPTRGLDYSMKEQLARMLRQLAEEGACIVVSTHDVEFASMATDRCLVMADGDLIADGTTQEVCTSSAAFSPQVAKVFWPKAVLTVADVQPRLAEPSGPPAAVLA